MKPDQERVNNLLRDTVTLLCKNGLTYTDELRVEALIGVTVDSNDVFLVHINERFGPGGEAKTSGAATELSSDNNSNRDGSQPPSNSGASSTREAAGGGGGQTPQQSPAHSAQTQRTGSADSGSVASPSWARDSSSGAHIDLTKVKLEAVDNEEECLVVRSPQAVARPAHIVAGQRRVLNRSAAHSVSSSSSTSHHQPSSQIISLSQDDTQAMRQQYSSASAIGGEDGSSFIDYDPDSGEPPPKLKRHADESEEDGGSPSFYGGENNQGSALVEASQAQWPNLADIAAQQAHQTFQDSGDGQLSDGNSLLPGCSSWPIPGSSQRGMITGGPGSEVLQSDDMGDVQRHIGFQQPELGMYRGRRPVHSQDKPYSCNYPGCNKSFYHRPNLYRHRKDHNHYMNNTQTYPGRGPLPTFNVFMSQVQKSSPDSKITTFSRSLPHPHLTTPQDSSGRAHSVNPSEKEGAI